jgi:ATP synthase protein I
MTAPEKRDGELEQAVRTRIDRRARWEQEGERAIGRNIAMIGAIGWLIVTPTLLGLFAGRWLDRHFGMNLFWTLSLLFIGLAAGCAMGWNKVNHE